MKKKIVRTAGSVGSRKGRLHDIHVVLSVMPLMFFELWTNRELDKVASANPLIKFSHKQYVVSYFSNYLD